MGVYSTLDVNREYVLNKIYEKLEKATNAELSEVLFELHGKKVLYNYIVWDDSVDIDP
jgi:hypothetical protein